MDNDEKLKELEQKLDGFKNKHKKPATSSQGNSGSLAMRVVTDLASGLLVGGVLGYFLDKGFETSPLFLVIFLFVGIAAGFLNLYRGLDRDIKDDK